MISRFFTNPKNSIDFESNNGISSLGKYDFILSQASTICIT